jgi:NAD(P)-dependent dehydrogenase (short-subunit alcohol dehydrogenase family)
MGETSFEGRTVVVFGGGGALGRSVVDRFLAEGATVVVAAATVPPSDVRQSSVAYAAVDALDEASVEGFLNLLDPAPWAVVNVIGGYTPGQPVCDLDLDVLRRQLDLNLVTATIITKHAVSRMMAAGMGGRIVHTSSRAAVGSGRNEFAYSVSKLGVIRLVEAAAAEAKELGITVNCVVPSIIDTPANRSAMPTADHARWPKPDQVAGVFTFLASDDAELISGAAIPVYGRT